jgi:hypothetical protein
MGLDVRTARSDGGRLGCPDLMAQILAVAEMACAAAAGVWDTLTQVHGDAYATCVKNLPQCGKAGIAMSMSSSNFLVGSYSRC